MNKTKQQTTPPDNTAVHQRNRSARKRADVRLCRFSARKQSSGRNYRLM
ncbi:MAG: hypothetical protein LBV75_01355 [Paludibacter sp.]|nr:hypothetical protein [Paludibacter sp.]